MLRKFLLQLLIYNTYLLLIAYVINVYLSKILHTQYWNEFTLNAPVPHNNFI